MRVHFSNGDALILSAGSVERNEMCRTWILGRAAAHNLLNKHKDANLAASAGLDADQFLVDKESEQVDDSEDPFLLLGSPSKTGGGGDDYDDDDDDKCENKSEADRWSGFNSVREAEHVGDSSNLKSAMGRSDGSVLLEGSLCTSIDFVQSEDGEEDPAGGRSEGAHPKGAGAKSAWKVLHFSLVMEREAADSNEQRGGPLLPFLRCYLNSRKKKRLLFKIPIAHSCVLVGGVGSFLCTLPNKFPYALGLETFKSSGDSEGEADATVIILCASTRDVIAKWAGVLTKTLTCDMRHMITAQDTSLLSSYLHDIVRGDKCVGTLKDVEVRVNVTQSVEGGGSNVEINLNSSGIRDMGLEEDGDEGEDEGEDKDKDKDKGGGQRGG